MRELAKIVDPYLIPLLVAVLPILLYLFIPYLERVRIRRRFGSGRVGEKLTVRADADRRRLVTASARPGSLFEEWVKLKIYGERLISFQRLSMGLRNIEPQIIQEVHADMRREVIDLWRIGANPDELKKEVAHLRDLSPLADRERLLGLIISANVLYLLGELKQGKELADETMRKARDYDQGKLPVMQWFASYACANSRLFLGQFEQAATMLGGMWQNHYLSLNEDEKKDLKAALRGESTLNPLVAVPRHMILASAFAGKALNNRETQLNPAKAELLEDDEGITQWYEKAQVLAEEEEKKVKEKIKEGKVERGEEEKRDAEISMYFSHAYMALYCLIVEPIQEPNVVLGRIPFEPGPVAGYTKHTVRGILLLKERRWRDANRAFRAAKLAGGGNGFLDGVLLPAWAISLAREERFVESGEMLEKGRGFAAKAQSAFYDALLDAAEAIFAKGESGESDQYVYLKWRALRQPTVLSRQFATILGLEEPVPPARMMTLRRRASAIPSSPCLNHPIFG